MAEGSKADLAELCRRLHGMPTAMRERKQWLLWRFESYKGDKKPRKVPYYVSGRKRHGGQGADHDREELATFEIALTHLERGRYDGMGFAFLPGDGLIGIDIDAAIDQQSGEVQERCQKIIEACASYTEYSPSGRGVHIVVAGEFESFRANNIGLEVYSGRQYFTCTGRRWAGTPAEVQPVDAKVLRRLKATKESAKALKPGGERAATPVEPNNDFQRVNAAALALLDSWVPSLFPMARKHSTGAWRVTSKELGREREEDLSLHRDGINDYGDEEGLTPIDVVIKFAGKTPRDALYWLADAVGIRLSKKGKGASQAQPASSEQAGEGGGGDGEPPTPSAGSAGDGEPPEPPDWRRKLLRTAEGGKKDCRENVYMCLVNHQALKGLVAYDEFAHVVMKLRQPPWDSPAGEWTTNDDYLLGFWLAQHERLTIKAEGTLVAGVAMAAFHARFNPLHDYLNGLPVWDQVERLPFWLHECLGAEDGEYTRLVGTWFIMGMVKRGLEPGCQMDYMVVLEGLQGKRKSTALRTLVGRDEWFADTPIRVGDKDAMLSLAGKWLYEVGELDSFNKAEVTAVKQYVSSRIDRVREPFARRPTDRKRSGVFGGTTNQSEYFKDPTGARRFWPVACDGEIDIDKIAQWRDQLYAEARHRLASDDADIRRYYPTREETDRLLVPQQEKREIVDPWFEKLALWLDSKATYADLGVEVREVDNFTSFELLTRALNVPLDRIDGGRQMATRVGIAMHRLGWIKERDATGPRVWRYWRPSSRKRAVAADATGGPDASGSSEPEVLHEF